jgi:hypothetical protein
MLPTEADLLRTLRDAVSRPAVLFASATVCVIAD